MGATLGIGYVMTLDMSWGPIRPLGDEVRNTWLLNWVIATLQAFIPGFIVQKVILLALFVLAGVGAHHLAAEIKMGKGNHQATLLYAAGFLYMINPFMYTRFVAGQWLVMAGYALLPWAVRAVWRLLQQPSAKAAVKAGGWLAAICLTSIHAMGFLPFIIIVLLAVSGRDHIRAKLGWLTAMGLALILVNLFWLVPLLTGGSSITSDIASFDSSQMKAFATHGTVLGNVPLSALLLSGFWADTELRYILPQATGWLWGVLAVIVLGLVLVGIYRVVRLRDRLGLALLILGAIAWYLSMGIAWEGSRAVTQWLADTVPMYAGYREPQKWLMLLALAYAYLLVHGAVLLYERLQVLGKRKTITRAHAQQMGAGLIAVVLLVPFAWTPLELFGANRQLRSVQYPVGWQQAKDALAMRGVDDDTKIVVLPWHMYMTMQFVGRTAANPAPNYFEGDIITSNNPELRGLPFETGGPVEDYMNYEFLPSRGQSEVTRHKLRQLGVEYILLLKEADYGRYEWLGSLKGLDRVVDNEDVRVYKVE